MSLSSVIVAFNVHDWFGGSFDVRRAKAWATNNADDQKIDDTSTGESRIGSGVGTVATDGTGTFTHWAPGADGNPISWQTSYHFDVPDRNAQGGRARKTFGPFTVTGTSKTVTNKALTTNVATLTTSTAHGLVVGNTITVAITDAVFDGTHTVTAVPSTTTLSYAKTNANVTSAAATGTLTSPNVLLTSLEQEQAVPATYLSTVTALLDTKVTAAQLAETNAGTAQAGAEAARDGAVAIVGPVDGTVEALVLNTGGVGPLTSAALSATIEAEAVPKVAAVSAGGVDVLGAPSAVYQGTKDVTTVFGGTTAYPHVLADGSSLPFLGGGYDNHVGKYPGAANPAILAVILGAHNLVDATSGHGSIGGGSYQAVHGDYGTAGGGTANTVHGTYGVVAGGRNNAAGAISKSTVATTAITAGATSFTAGTVSGKAIATGMTLVVDVGVKAEVFLNVTVAGSTVTLAGADTFALAHSVGAAAYFLDGTGTDATVGGGQSNDAYALQSTVGGGYNNKARGTATTIAGGTSNIAGTATAANATVGGGSGNVASAAGATIGGGPNNVANGTNAVVPGGTLNTASATASGVTHGSSNTASAQYALAGGANAVADHYGEQAFASGSFSVVGDAQASDLLARAVISGAGTGELFLDQSTARLTLADNTAYRFKIETMAYARTSSATVPNTIVGVWKTEGAIYRKTGAANTIMFSNTTTADAANTVGFDFAASADTTNGSLKLLGTCIASHAVYFESRIYLTKITG